MTPEELAYLAGFVDGEGSLQIQRRTHRNEFGIWTGYSIYLDVGQTRRDILEYIQQKAGGAIHRKPSQGNRKEAWMLRVSGSQAQEFVSQLRPYLRVKAEIADVFLAFKMNGRKPHTDEQKRTKDALFMRAKELNHRGL